MLYNGDITSLMVQTLGIKDPPQEGHKISAEEQLRKNQRLNDLWQQTKNQRKYLSRKAVMPS